MPPNAGCACPARVEDRSVDPVAPFAWTTLGVVDDVLKHATASSDHTRRGFVVQVTRHEDTSNVVRAKHDQALLQNLGGETSPTKLRPHGVADVAAYREQVVVQCVTDRGPPDHLIPDNGKQERGWHPRRRKLRRTSHEIQLLDVCRPRGVGPEAYGEVEGVGLKLSMGRPDDVFVGEPNWVQAEIGSAHSCTMPDSIAATTSHIAGSGRTSAPTGYAQVLGGSSDVIGR